MSELDLESALNNGIEKPEILKQDQTFLLSLSSHKLNISCFTFILCLRVVFFVLEIPLTPFSKGGRGDLVFFLVKTSISDKILSNIFLALIRFT